MILINKDEIVLDFLANLLRSYAGQDVEIDPVEIKDVSFQGEGDTEVLFHYDNRAYAISIERF